jgi:hypothetical protein
MNTDYLLNRGVFTQRSEITDNLKTQYFYKNNRKYYKLVWVFKGYLMQ